ncbi:MAG: hypothetical protein A4E65_02976 [Syntrophorhabdus sp. PtaU1.Bin153]|nr:MAG: hypothetical protein A4E65_02976 [Syntrophorhabdus sp. PtaU1.Bin153]
MIKFLLHTPSIPMTPGRTGSSPRGLLHFNRPTVTVMTVEDIDTVWLKGNNNNGDCHAAKRRDSKRQY